MAGHDKSTHGRIWSTLQVREARNRTSSYAGVSRHGVRILSKVRTLASHRYDRKSRIPEA